MKNSDRQPQKQTVFQAVLALAGSGADLSAVRVQQIADAAGMGKGTLYEYFKSKNEILAGTVEWCVQQELERTRALLERAATFDELLGLAADYICQLVTQRVESYMMVAGVLHGAHPAEKGCGMMDGAARQMAGLNARAYALARRTGHLAPDVGEEYLGYAISTAVVGYAGTLFRQVSCFGGLDEDFTTTARQNFLRMVQRALA